MRIKLHFDLRSCVSSEGLLLTSLFHIEPLGKNEQSKKKLTASGVFNKEWATKYFNLCEITGCMSDLPGNGCHF